MQELEDLPFDRLDGAADRVDRICAGDQVGLILRSAIPPSALTAIVAQAEGGALPSMDPGHYLGRNFGPTLIVCGPDLEAYFASSGSLRGLSGDGLDVQAHIHALLGRLSGRETQTPKHRSARSYAPVGLRSVVPGGTISLHCERETLGFPCMADLTPQLDSSAILSFYTVLSLPEEGGELEIYPLEFATGPGAALQSLRRSGPELEAYLAPHTPVRARVGVGDLLVFDAGRYYHRVTPIRGSRARWTLGGFLARSADRRVIYAWN